MEFGIEGGSCNSEKQGLVNLRFCKVDFEGIEELETLLFGSFVAVGDDSGMNTILDKSLCLFHHFSNEKNVRSSAVSYNVILSSGRTSDHCSSRVLNLLFIIVHINISMNRRLPIENIYHVVK